MTRRSRNGFIPPLGEDSQLRTSPSSPTFPFTDRIGMPFPPLSHQHLTTAIYIHTAGHSTFVFLSAVDQLAHQSALLITFVAEISQTHLTGFSESLPESAVDSRELINALYDHFSPTPRSSTSRSSTIAAMAASAPWSNAKSVCPHIPRLFCDLRSDCFNSLQRALPSLLQPPMQPPMQPHHSLAVHPRLLSHV